MKVNSSKASKNIQELYIEKELNRPKEQKKKDDIEREIRQKLKEEEELNQNH